MSSKVLRVIQQTDPAFKWVGLKKIYWQDPKGTERIWEAAHRRTRKGDIDAVSITTIIHSKNKGDQILLVSQFRPPVNKYVIECPAGLVDENETCIQAAIRELKEETGYIGHESRARSSPILASDAGMSESTMKSVIIHVDEEEKSEATPDEGEFIEVLKLPHDKTLAKELDKLVEERGCSVDSRLYTYAQGLEMIGL